MCLVGRIVFGIIFFYLYLLFKEMGDGGEGAHWYFPSGFFEHDGKPLTDKQVRDLVNWGIEHGCETEADIPSEELPGILFPNKDKKNDDNQLELFGNEKDNVQ